MMRKERGRCVSDERRRAVVLLGLAWLGVLLLLPLSAPYLPRPAAHDHKEVADDGRRVVGARLGQLTALR